MDPSAAAAISAPALPPRVLVVTTTSPIKRAVVERYVAQNPASRWLPRFQASQAHTPAQPLGHDGGIGSAWLRIRDAMLRAPGADAYMAIESYLSGCPPADGAPVRDTAAVLVALPSLGVMVARMGMALEVSPRAGDSGTVREAVAEVAAAALADAAAVGAWEGGARGVNVTLGSALARRLPGLPADDWMRELLGVPREEQLQPAVDAALDAAAVLLASRVWPDWPAPGVQFMDLNPSMRDAHGLRLVRRMLAREAASVGLQRGDPAALVVGLEARGFTLGAMLAADMDVGFLPARKPGKLPGELLRADYVKEYGVDALTMSTNLLQLPPGVAADKLRVFIVDDVLATGGTLSAVVAALGTLPHVEVCGAIVLAVAGGFTAKLITPGGERDRVALTAFAIPEDVAGGGRVTSEPRGPVGSVSVAHLQRAASVVKAGSGSTGALGL